MYRQPPISVSFSFSRARHSDHLTSPLFSSPVEIARQFHRLWKLSSSSSTCWDASSTAVLLVVVWRSHWKWPLTIVYLHYSHSHRSTKHLPFFLPLPLVHFLTSSVTRSRWMMGASALYSYIATCLLLVLIVVVCFTFSQTIVTQQTADNNDD